MSSEPPKITTQRLRMLMSLRSSDLDISKKIVSLQRTINEIHSKVNLAQRLKKPKLLMQQYHLILRQSETARTEKLSIQQKMADLIRIDIDDKKEERKLVMNAIREDLEKLSYMNDTINMLATSEADMAFVDALMECVQDAVMVMESVKTTLDYLPPVDQTYLEYEQQLARDDEMMKRYAQNFKGNCMGI